MLFELPDDLGERVAQLRAVAERAVAGRADVHVGRGSGYEGRAVDRAVGSPIRGRMYPWAKHPQ